MSAVTRSSYFQFVGSIGANVKKSKKAFNF